MRIIIVASYPLIRQGLISIISGQKDIEIVGDASNISDGLALIDNTKPNIALVDANLGDTSGLKYISEARQTAKDAKFILFGFYGSNISRFIVKAMNEKVDGYMLREALPIEILYAIRQVHRGRKYFDSDLLKYIDNKVQYGLVPELTNREQEILIELAKGLSNNEIAQRLFITEHTVKKHVSHILEKLELSDRTQAAIYAYNKGLIG